MYAGDVVDTQTSASYVFRKLLMLNKLDSIYLCGLSLHDVCWLAIRINRATLPKEDYELWARA